MGPLNVKFSGWLRTSQVVSSSDIPCGHVGWEFYLSLHDLSASVMDGKWEP